MLSVWRFTRGEKCYFNNSFSCAVAISLPNTYIKWEIFPFPLFRFKILALYIEKTCSNGSFVAIIKKWSVSQKLIFQITKFYLWESYLAPPYLDAEQVVELHWPLVSSFLKIGLWYLFRDLFWGLHMYKMPRIALDTSQPINKY